MDKRQFILNTLLPYKEKPETCAGINGSCYYLMADGRKCAVGKHMIEGFHQGFSGDVDSLNHQFGLDKILTDEAKQVGLSVDEWQCIQRYHDTLSDFSDGQRSQYDVNLKVFRIEDITGLDFPELKFNI